MRSGTLLALAWKESRSARRRLLLYMSSISLGVASLVAIDSFASNTQRSVRDQARTLLGGDIALSTRSTFPPAVLDSVRAVERQGARTAEVTSFTSMALVQRSGATRLAQIRGVTAGYPFYGTILTSPAHQWDRLHDGRFALVDPSLLIALDARIGDTLALGFARFIIIGTLTSVPGDIAVASAIGPRVYIPARYLDETSLLLFGSRSERQLLVKLPAQLPARAFAVRFRTLLAKADVRLRTAADTELSLTDAIAHLRDFLSIIGVVALLLGGIGVASGVNAFVMRKIDTVAILRCLGATSRQVLAIYLLQAAAMGFVGAAVGTVLGIGLQLLLPRVMADFLPVDVSVSLEPSALLTGLAVGVWVAFVFALRPLVALRNVSPLQTLRRESDAQALRATGLDLVQLLVTGVVLASVAALGVARAGTVRQGLGFAAAISAAIAALYLAAAAASDAARRIVRPHWSFPLRQGVASLYRPGNQTRSVILALGFGVFLMSTVYEVQDNLLRIVGRSVSASRGNVLFFDIQEDQGAPLDSLIRAHGFAVAQRAPMVPMKIVAINSRRGSAILKGDTTAGDGRPARPEGWVLRREYRSTYRNMLMPSERVRTGRFHTGGSVPPALPEVSLDVAVANDLHVSVNDTITWNVQGVEIPTRVTSLREVAWSRFEPNFFVVFETRALEHAPKQFIMLADVRGDDAVARLQRDVVRRFPNVASLDLTLVQRTVGRVLDKVTAAIRFMAGLSLALAIPVLFSAVSATRRERLREGVLLKVLGATRRQVGRIMLAEYLLLGALGSLVGVALSLGGAWALMRVVFRQPFVPVLLPALLVAALMVALAVSIGMLTGRDVFRETPMAALREG